MTKGFCHYTVYNFGIFLLNLHRVKEKENVLTKENVLLIKENVLPHKFIELRSSINRKKYQEPSFSNQKKYKNPDYKIK